MLKSPDRADKRVLDLLDKHIETIPDSSGADRSYYIGVAKGLIMSYVEGGLISAHDYIEYLKKIMLLE